MLRRRLHNLPDVLHLRRTLRASLTPAEARLWLQLRHSQLDGWKFRRQHSVGSYVLDFYCPGARLAVELDGAAHDHEAAQVRDKRRTEFLNDAGVRVIRFENHDVVANLEGVLAEIRRVLAGG